MPRRVVAREEIELLVTSVQKVAQGDFEALYPEIKFELDTAERANTDREYAMAPNKIGCKACPLRAELRLADNCSCRAPT